MGMGYTAIEGQFWREGVYDVDGVLVLVYCFLRAFFFPFLISVLMLLRVHVVWDAYISLCHDVMLRPCQLGPPQEDSKIHSRHSLLWS